MNRKRGTAARSGCAMAALLLMSSLGAEARAAERLATLPAGAFVAEGLAPVRSGRGWLVSGVLSQTILRVGGGPAQTYFRLQDAELGLFNLLVDRRRGVLWVSASPMPGHNAASKLLELDWRTGRLIAERFGPAAPKSSFGDLAIDAKGRILVSDSGNGRILRLSPAARTLEVISSGAFRSPQGLAPARHGALIVSDYGRGLFVLRPDGGVAPLPLPQGVALRGLDTLVDDGRELIAVQNGGDPQQVLAIRLDASGSRVAEVKVLAQGPPLIQPTGALVQGRRLIVVAHSQWEAVADNGSFDPGAPPAEIDALPLPLAEASRLSARLSILGGLIARAAGHHARFQLEEFLAVGRHLQRGVHVGKGLRALAPPRLDAGPVRTEKRPARVVLDRPGKILQRLVHLSEVPIGDAAVVEGARHVGGRQPAVLQADAVELDPLAVGLGLEGGAAGAEVRPRGPGGQTERQGGSDGEEKSSPEHGAI